MAVYSFDAALRSGERPSFGRGPAPSPSRMTGPARAPVIVIGMHRSGTSLLCRCLEALGLFVGRWKQWNNESPFFQIINEWLLRSHGATYKTIGPLLDRLADPAARERAVDVMRRLTESAWSALYLGPARYLRYRGLRGLDFPWGWKDPRSTVTLALWLAVFPDAKVLHIYRHGVDVANSLRQRRRRLINRCIATAEEVLGRTWNRPDCGAGYHTRRLLSLEGGFSLWEEYLREARAHLAPLGSRALELRYEDFLAEPAGPLARLAEYCELPAGPELVRRVAGRARPQRAYAFKRNAELQAFADRVDDRLRAFGYSPSGR